MLIYSDDWTDSCKNIEATIEKERKYIFDEYAEEEGWETIDDIPDSWGADDIICQRLEENNTIYFEDEVAPYLDKIFDNDMIWNGDYFSNYQWFRPSINGGYTITDNGQEIWDWCTAYSSTSIEIYDDNGVLKLVIHDHDGTNTMYGRILTKNGTEVYHEWKENPYFDDAEGEWLRKNGYSEEDLKYYKKLRDMSEWDICDMLFKSDEYSENVYLAEQMGIV